LTLYIFILLFSIICVTEKNQVDIKYKDLKTLKKGTKLQIPHLLSININKFYQIKSQRIKIILINRDYNNLSNYNEEILNKNNPIHPIQIVENGDYLPSLNCIVLNSVKRCFTLLRWYFPVEVTGIVSENTITFGVL
jgi:hypothetical protein